jgi:hypothetical protein
VVTNLGTGNASTGITGAVLLINGIQVGSQVTFNGNQAIFNLGSAIISGNTHLDVDVNFNNTAVGNFQIANTAVSGTSGNNGGQAVVFTGIPLSGNDVIVAQPSPTFTPSATFTPTPSPTRTLTPTWTVTPVPSVALGRVGIFPNPVQGTTVNIFPAFYLGQSDIRVEIFTIAFRKVKDETFRSVPASTAVAVSLTDAFGRPMSNGLYYVIVTARSGKATGIMLILR